MDVNEELHQLVSGRVKFDTGNDAATAISEMLVNDLGLEPNPSRREKCCYRESLTRLLVW